MVTARGWGQPAAARRQLLTFFPLFTDALPRSHNVREMSSTFMSAAQVLICDGHTSVSLHLLLLPGPSPSSAANHAHSFQHLCLYPGGCATLGIYTPSTQKISGRVTNISDDAIKEAITSLLEATSLQTCGVPGLLDAAILLADCHRSLDNGCFATGWQETTPSARRCVPLAPTAVSRLKRKTESCQLRLLQNPPDVAPGDTTTCSRGHGPDKRGRPSACHYRTCLS